MTASKIFLYFCLSFVAGIFINSFVKIPQLLMLGILVLGIILISVLWNCKKIVLLGFCILFSVLGIFRHQNAEIKISESESQIYNDSEKDIVLIGIVSEEPDVKEKTTKLIINAEKVEESGSPQNLGNVLVTVNRYPEYRYGDKLKIKGKLKTPSEDINGFNYKDYLKKDGIYSVMSWPEIKVIGYAGNPIMAALFSFKNKFKETAQKLISPPEEGVLEALVFGDEGNISKEWKDKLNISGTRHIAAVSGMNITIISSLLLSLLLAIGFWRNQAFYFSVVLLVLYILMIGAPASAVRAGVMAGIFLTAQHFGRMSAAARAIVFASAFMLFSNPLLLRLDIGFQLSFLAIMGLIYLQPVFSDFFKKIPNPKLFPIKTTLSATFSAQVFTLPILIYNFGYISLVSPITNLLIVPFLAPITILIFIFGIFGMAFSFLGYIFSLPVWFCLSYIVRIIDVFSGFSFSVYHLEISWGFAIIFYLILGVIVWRLREAQKLKFLRY